MLTTRKQRTQGLWCINVIETTIKRCHGWLVRLILSPSSRFCWFTTTYGNDNSHKNVGLSG